MSERGLAPLSPQQSQDIVLVEPPQNAFAELQRQKANPELALYLEEADLGKPMEALELTIKQDRATKAITFLSMVGALTEHDSFNVIFKADSATGKSYIALETARFFPPERVLKLSYVSPTAFWHDNGVWDDNRKALIVDFSGKILIFKDQPHDDLLKRLRSYLSHDDEESQFLITDKSERKGLRTKRVILRGKPTVIFCTAKMRLDEQEANRGFLLSPEVSQDKLKESLELIFMREQNNIQFDNKWYADPLIQWLRTRITYLASLKIAEVIVPDADKIKQEFLKRYGGYLTPRAQRDAKRLIYLVKAAAVFNVWTREVTEGEKGLIVTANARDAEQALLIYSQIAEAQELGLPPQTLHIFRNVIESIAASNEAGVDFKAIQRAYFEFYHRRMNYSDLCRETIPSLEDAGLIITEPNPVDKRQKLVKVA